MSAHQFDANRRPDSEFVAGQLKHLVKGNRGRLLDPRRTPVCIVEMRTDCGYFVVELLDFEDKGAHWEVPLEDAGNYQFERTCAIAPEDEIDIFRGLVDKFDKTLEIPVAADARAATLDRLRPACDDTREWLQTHSTHFAAGTNIDLLSPRGSPELAADLRSYLAEHGLLEIEDLFATQYVRGPGSGEWVKGHRIVLAELGLVPYVGKIVRDPSIFDGVWSREQRARHLVARLAFVRSCFGLAGHSTLTLYRGISCDGTPQPPINRTFVSTSSNFDIAKSCSGETDRSKTGVIYRQTIPVERAFMTYLETAQMNAHYQESEVVLLFDPENAIF